MLGAGEVAPLPFLDDFGGHVGDPGEGVGGRPPLKWEADHGMGSFAHPIIHAGFPQIVETHDDPPFKSALLRPGHHGARLCPRLEGWLGEDAY